MKRFRLVDNLMGWIIFAVAAFTYCSTIEPTASFWDCPEFITTGYKLEVGHPPGAPFFMLTANLFSQFASDPTQVAYMVNTMSALLSAFCILFLYWSISHLVRRLICKDGKVETQAQLISIEGSAVVGALAYTWSDTFWFSAVEGEVYAYSSLFTALVVWLMLKWEDCSEQPHSDRWIILIAYMTGLSIGVHLLNLLCVPALVLIFYYKKFKNVDMKGTFIALFISFLLLAVVLYGIVPGIVKVGGWSELLFVNVLGLPFNTGLIFYIVALVGTVVWALWETYSGKNANRCNTAYLLSIALLGIPFMGGHGTQSILLGLALLAVMAWVLWFKDWITARLKSTSLLCMLMIMIGYSSYAVIVIRSSANTPMDQNSPEDIFTLGEYLGREQYGDRPLLYGQTFASELEWENPDTPAKVEGAPVYQQVEKVDPNEPDRYRIVRYKDQYKYQYNVLFPRMYDDGHAADYKEMLPNGFQGKLVQMQDRDGRPITVKVPTFWENLQFFFGYQVSNMYLRYFMWNFAGRQNDIQNGNYYELEHGNWLTGISVFDNPRLGDQSLLPDDLKGNKGRNLYFCLPLLLGLIGMFWQIMRDDESIKQFWVVFFLFFMTGLAIVIYLNQTPGQPRERDYAYAGSFYAFAIWIGMAVAAVTDLLNKYLKKYDSRQFRLATAILPCLLVLVPLQMVSQSWDDHDRSGRYACRDFGKNYLQSLCPEGNPIIFTNGDNDTFPLWYLQETEGFRTDARVCNLSYLQTDWYIDQMKRPAYDSPALPISWKRIEYVTGTNEYVRVLPNALADALDLLKSEGKTEAQIAEILGENPSSLRTAIDKWVLNRDQAVVDLKQRLQANYQSQASYYMNMSERARQSLDENGMTQNDNRSRYYAYLASAVVEPILPATNLVIPVKKEDVLASGMKIPGNNPDNIPSYMTLTFKNAVYKKEMMLLDMLANANWRRPMYIAVTVGDDSYSSVARNLVQEGLVYRITPFTQSAGAVDTDKMYDNVMNKFVFGGIDKEGVYLDETVLRMCWTHRRMFATLASELLNEADELEETAQALSEGEQEGVSPADALAEAQKLLKQAADKRAKAKAVLEKAEKSIPNATVPHSLSSGSLELAEAWASLGGYAQAQQIADVLHQSGLQYMNWFNYAVQSGKRTMNSTLYYRDAIHPITGTFGIYVHAAVEETAKGKKDEAKKLYDRVVAEIDVCGTWYNGMLSGMSSGGESRMTRLFMSEYMDLVQQLKSIVDATKQESIQTQKDVSMLYNVHMEFLNQRYEEFVKAQQEASTEYDY